MPTLYDRLSRGYDRLSASEHPLVEAGLRRLAAGPGQRVLEIGTGTGYALPALAAAVQPGGCVLGLDRSSGMLRAAGARLRRVKAVAGLVRGDANCLPFGPAVFDQAVSQFYPGIVRGPASARRTGRVPPGAAPGGIAGGGGPAGDFPTGLDEPGVCLVPYPLSPGDRLPADRGRRLAHPRRFSNHLAGDFFPVGTAGSDRDRDPAGKGIK